jgi:hypothetical protein
MGIGSGEEVATVENEQSARKDKSSFDDMRPEAEQGRLGFVEKETILLFFSQRNKKD